MPAQRRRVGRKKIVSSATPPAQSGPRPPHHDEPVPCAGAANDGGEDGAWRVVASKPSLHDAAAIVQHDCRDFPFSGKNASKGGRPRVPLRNLGAGRRAADAGLALCRLRIGEPCGGRRRGSRPPGRLLLLQGGAPCRPRPRSACARGTYIWRERGHETDCKGERALTVG